MDGENKESVDMFDELEGYTTQDGSLCLRCAFAIKEELHTDCERNSLCLRARCMPDQREDGRNVIFVKIQLDNQSKL